MLCFLVRHCVLILLANDETGAVTSSMQQPHVVFSKSALWKTCRAILPGWRNALLAPTHQPKVVVSIIRDGMLGCCADSARD